MATKFHLWLNFNHKIDGLVFLTLKIIIVENNVNKLQNEFWKYLLAKVNSFLKAKAFVNVYQLINKPMHQIWFSHDD
jgi:uncharacterized membrane protein YobD (UPF0266 family)